MIPATLQRVVYAKLRSTGEYALAGWSDGLTRASAEELAYQCTVGQADLADGELAFSSLITPDGSRALVGTTRGRWLDGAGRPWLHQHIVLVPPDIFDQCLCDPFAFMPAVRTVEVLEVQSPLPMLNLPVLSETEISGGLRRALEAVSGDSRLPRLLTSVFSREKAYWTGRSDPLPLLAACVAALPPLARTLFTFVSLAAQRPRLDAKLLVARSPIPGLGEGRAARLDLDGPGGAPPGANSSASPAAIVAGWIATRDWETMEEWHRAADQFILDQGLELREDRVASAIEQSLVWVTQIRSAAATPSGPDDLLADALRGGAELNVRPPPDAVCALFEDARAAPSAEAVAAGLALTATRPDRGWERVAAAAGRRWASGSQGPGEWAILLDRSQEVVAGAAAKIVEAAAPEFVRSLRQSELLSIAGGMPDDREWSASWPRVIAAAWEQSRGGWLPQALLECVIRPGSGGLSLPPASWIERFGQHYGAGTTPSPAIECASTVASLSRAAPEAVARLARLAYGGSGGEGAAMAEDLLLWALTAEDAPLSREEVARTARDSLAEPPRLEAFSEASHPARLSRRALVHLLTADGARLPFPRLAAWNADQLGQLQSVLAGLARGRRGAGLGPAALWVAAAVVSHHPRHPRADAAIWCIDQEIARPLDGTQGADLMAALVGVVGHAGLSPEARGTLLWWVLASATAEGTGGDGLRKRVEGFVRHEVACDAWPPAPPGAPLLSLECVAALVDAACGAGALHRCRDVIVAAAERIGHSGRERGIARAIGRLSEAVALLEFLCTAQDERDPKNPLPVSAEIKSAASGGQLPRGVGTAVKAALPEEPRTLRLRLRRGWK